MQDAARIARAMAPSVFEPFDPEKHGSPVNHEFAKSMWMKKATTAISAMHQTTQCAGCEGNPAPENSPCAAHEATKADSFDRGWNAAIEAAKWAVGGYIHPDHGRLPGEAFASAQIDKLKKDTGNG
jgi:hypothetical protein